MTSSGLPRVQVLLFVLGFVAHQVLGQIQSGGYGMKQFSLFARGNWKMVFDVEFPYEQDNLQLYCF